MLTLFNYYPTTLTFDPLPKREREINEKECYLLSLRQAKGL